MVVLTPAILNKAVFNSATLLGPQPITVTLRNPVPTAAILKDTVLTATTLKDTDPTTGTSKYSSQKKLCPFMPSS